VSADHVTREAWLLAAVEALRPAFCDAGRPIPEAVRVSCGFPSRGALARSKRRIGECWDGAAATDGVSQMLISPTLIDPVEVLGVLVHELVHAAVGCKAGHKGPFKRLAKTLGLEGKMTMTTVGAELGKRLAAMAESIGAYPHAALNASSKPKQKARMLKAACPACGAIIRASRQVLDSPGLPICACDGATRFEEAS